MQSLAASQAAFSAVYFSQDSLSGCIGGGRARNTRKKPPRRLLFLDLLAALLGRWAVIEIRSPRQWPDEMTSRRRCRATMPNSVISCRVARYALSMPKCRISGSFYAIALDNLG